MDEKPLRIDEMGVTTDSKRVRGSRTSALWIGMILSAIVLTFLLIFILQNGDPAQIYFLGWATGLPTGVALLFAAIAGVLLVAIPGSIRIHQLRRASERGGGRGRNATDTSWPGDR